MATVWMTCSELRGLVAEELVGSTADREANRARMRAAMSSIRDEEDELAAVSDRRAQQPNKRLDLRGSGRPRYVGPLRDPTAFEPYSSEELSSGADVESKRPSIMARLRNMFLGGKEKRTDAFEEPPAHWSLDKKREFHRQRLDQLRNAFDKYRNMMRVADTSHRDPKRASYAKRHMQRFHAAMTAHRQALEGIA